MLRLFGLPARFPFGLFSLAGQFARGIFAAAFFSLLQAFLFIAALLFAFQFGTALRFLCVGLRLRIAFGLDAGLIRAASFLLLTRFAFGLRFHASYFLALGIITLALSRFLLRALQSGTLLFSALRFDGFRGVRIGLALGFFGALRFQALRVFPLTRRAALFFLPARLFLIALGVRVTALFILLAGHLIAQFLLAFRAFFFLLLTLCARSVRIAAPFSLRGKNNRWLRRLGGLSRLYRHASLRLRRLCGLGRRDSRWRGASLRFLLTHLISNGSLTRLAFFIHAGTITIAFTVPTPRALRIGILRGLRGRGHLCCLRGLRGLSRSCGLRSLRCGDGRLRGSSGLCLRRGRRP